jgi:hypothetical protein
LATQLKRDELMRLARVGAAARLAELHREIASLEAVVGETPRRAAAPPRGSRVAAPTRAKKREPRQAAPAASRRAKSSWSAAARKAVSLRMKKYWAARRQAEKG